ncbi:MAG: NADP-dependent malic enzyme [Caedimonas sp.]|nr:NADP-dependent malic enzyme [Caedimonas sp.]
MTSELYESALAYHRFPRPGKLAITPTKPLSTQLDLSLAYTPGVAAACDVIVRNPKEISNLTARSNLVAVITNGTAVLGLGNIGPCAAKPVMEGKAVLFKKFAGIDVFDIEINQEDPYKLVDIIASLEPTFGAINLEDIKAPECFIVEEELKKRVKIPVFHDDQHGTAIIVGAAILNGLELVGKTISSVKLVCCGAGAAAIACLKLLVHLGLKRENVFVMDTDGLIYKGRTVNMDPHKKAFAQDTSLRTLPELLKDADIFLGVSAGNIIKPEWLKAMRPNPLILALANPTPEIFPDEAKKACPDAIVATGRSDHPNQVNNVLCFPFIFRAALDVGATTINEEMKLACVKALADLAKAELSDVVAGAYDNTQELKFGPDYIIPKPFDPRLMIELAPAVARAAMDSGVATRPLESMDAYRQQLIEYVFRSGLTMKPIVMRAKKNPMRIVYAEGEEERVLQACQIVVDEGLARPLLVGRRSVVQTRIERLGLRLAIDRDFELVDPQQDDRYPVYWQYYHSLMERKGISPADARTMVRTSATVIAALMVGRGDADAFICGSYGHYMRHLHHIKNLIGLKSGASVWGALNAIVVEGSVFFITDTYVNEDPSAREIAEITLMAIEQVREFGFTPKVALLSHSNFGSSDSASAQKMREAMCLLHKQDPGIEIEGEMHADSALNEVIRMHIFPHSRLKGSANLLVMPNLDAANISYNLVKSVADGQSIGPLLLGGAKPGHILTPSVTVRGIINMSAMASVEAQKYKHSASFL